MKKLLTLALIAFTLLGIENLHASKGGWFAGGLATGIGVSALARGGRRHRHYDDDYYYRRPRRRVIEEEVIVRDLPDGSVEECTIKRSRRGRYKEKCVIYDA